MCDWAQIRVPSSSNTSRFVLYMFIYRHFDLPAVNGKFWSFTADKRPVNGKNTCLGNKKLCSMKWLQNVSKFASFYLYENPCIFYHHLFHLFFTFSLKNAQVYGRIHLPLMDRPLNMCDIKLSFFSSEFNETWWSCSTHRVIQLHQVLLHSDEKNNSFISNTFNGQSVRKRQVNWAYM